MASDAQGSRGAGEGAPSLLEALVAGQIRAVEVLKTEQSALIEAAHLVAGALRRGGRLIYIGAGSSGMLAMLDGLELPGTFGLNSAQLRFVSPNGERFFLDGSVEDDKRAGEAAVDALSQGENDVAVAVSASGSTPFTLAAARRAKAAGTPLVAVVCRSGAPLAALADRAVVLDVGPEAVEGSTRLAAGTAQKAALGIVSTLAAAELGWVHRGLMVRVRPENAKLRARARGIVARLAGVGEAAAAAALAEARNDVPVAIVAAGGGIGGATARALIARHDGSVADALASLRPARDEATSQIGSQVSSKSGMRPARSGGDA